MFVQKYNHQIQIKQHKLIIWISKHDNLCMMTETTANIKKSQDDIVLLHKLVNFMLNKSMNYCSSQMLYKKCDSVKHIWAAQQIYKWFLCALVVSNVQAPHRIFSDSHFQLFSLQIGLVFFSSALPSGGPIWEDQRLKSHVGLSKSLFGSNLKCLSETRCT